MHHKYPFRSYWSNIDDKTGIVNTFSLLFRIAWPLLNRIILVIFKLDLNFLHILFFFVVFADTLISRLPFQHSLDVSPEWTQHADESEYSSIQYDFRVTCDTHYYGKGCADLCRPRDDQFGHYTCSSTGSIVCLSGWQGDYCTKRKCLLK